MERKHKRKDCNVHHITFGGHCLNCGINASHTVHVKKQSDENRKQFLRKFGFEFDNQEQFS